MQIRLASFSSLVFTEGGYFVTGGIGDRFKNAKFSTFMFDPYSFEAVELEPMVTARFRFGSIGLSNRVYVFGGHKEINSVTRECEMYDL